MKLSFYRARSSLYFVGLDGKQKNKKEVVIKDFFPRVQTNWILKQWGWGRAGYQINNWPNAWLCVRRTWNALVVYLTELEKSISIRK